MGRKLVALGAFLVMLCFYPIHYAKERISLPTYVRIENEIANVTVPSKPGHEDLILKRHAAVLANATEPRLIAYQCTNFCGGLGDRVRGVVTSFILALLTDSQFVVNYRLPVNIEHYFNLPCTDLYNLSTNGIRSEVVVDHANRRWPSGHAMRMDVNAIDGNDAFFSQSSTSLLSSIRNVKFLVVQSNQGQFYKLLKRPEFIGRARYYGLENLDYEHVFGLVVRLFFSKPREQLKKAVDKELHKIPVYQRIGVQIRTGDNFGDPLRYQYESITCFVREAVKMCKESTSCGIYVTSDSNRAKQMFIQQLQDKLPGASVLAPQSSILHPDRAKIEPFSRELFHRWIPHFVEWRLLWEMNSLVICDSGFSRTVAWATQVPTVTVEQNCEIEDPSLRLKEWNGDALMKESKRAP